MPACRPGLSYQPPGAYERSHPVTSEAAKIVIAHFQRLICWLSLYTGLHPVLEDRAPLVLELVGSSTYSSLLVFYTGKWLNMNNRR